MSCNRGTRITVGNIPDFWEQVGSAQERFLGLDYDGTLAPFHVDPLQATPLPGVIPLLQALVNQPGTSIAIVSGRPAAEVSMLLHRLPVTLVGSHGFELWRPTDATPHAIPPSPEQQAGLTRAKETALQMGYGPKLEYKIASIALHTRGLAVELASSMEEGLFTAWSGIASGYPLECRRFNGGVEIRCLGRHKGDALSELLRAEPRGTLPVYVGDDETDEDVFRVLRGQGIGIKVGSPSSPTAAKGFLKDCEAVKQFLETWVSLTDTPRR